MKDYLDWVPEIRNAGSVFLGHYSPESAGDYASGTNHTLPTNGYARAYSGVNMDAFMKKITFQEITPEGLLYLGKTIEMMADNEKLEAHGNAVRVRNLEFRIWNESIGRYSKGEYKGVTSVFLCPCGVRGNGCNLAGCKRESICVGI